MKIKDSHITVNIKDMDRSVSFYESIGLTMIKRWENYYSMLSAPGLVIGLHPTADENLKDNSGNISIGFTTEDFEETRSELQKLEIVIIERQEEGGQFLHFTDPDGNAIYFIKPNW